jgi:hypothetical protein
MGKYIPPTAAEIHSLGVGLMDGVRASKSPYKKIAKAQELIPDIEKEPHYYRAGYFVTNRLKWIVGGAAAWNLV